MFSETQTPIDPHWFDTIAPLCRHAAHSQLLSVALSNKQNFLCQSVYKRC